MFPLISSQDHCVSSQQSCGCCARQAASWHRQNKSVTQEFHPEPKLCKLHWEPGAQAGAAADMLDIPCLLEFWSKDVFIEMLSTVVHFLSRDCGSLILLISRFTFKFEFIPESTHSLWDTDWTSPAHHHCPRKHWGAHHHGYVMLPRLCFWGTF